VDVNHGIEAETSQLLDDIRGALLSGVQDAEIIPEKIEYKHMVRIPQYFEVKQASEWRCHQVLSRYEPQDWDEEEVEVVEYEELL